MTCIIEGDLYRAVNHKPENEVKWGGQRRCNEVKLRETAAEAERHRAEGMLTA